MEKRVRPVLENCYAFAHFSGSCFWENHKECQMKDCPCDCHPDHDKYFKSFLTYLREYINEKPKLESEKH